MALSSGTEVMFPPCSYLVLTFVPTLTSVVRLCSSRSYLSLAYVFIVLDDNAPDVVV